MRSYALPLFALIDRAKVDLSRPIPEELGEQIQGWLAAQCRIHALHAKVLVPHQAEPLLVLLGVEPNSLPALCALAEVQRCTLSEYQRAGEDRFTLIPLSVKPD